MVPAYFNPRLETDRKELAVGLQSLLSGSGFCQEYDPSQHTHVYARAIDGADRNRIRVHTGILKTTGLCQPSLDFGTDHGIVMSVVFRNWIKHPVVIKRGSIPRQGTVLDICARTLGLMRSMWQSMNEVEICPLCGQAPNSFVVGTTKQQKGCADHCSDRGIAALAIPTVKPVSGTMSLMSGLPAGQHYAPYYAPPQNPCTDVELEEEPPF